MIWKQQPEVFYKKAVLNNLGIFCVLCSQFSLIDQWRVILFSLCWRLLFNKVADLQALFFLDFTNELNALLCNNVSEGTTFNFSLIRYCPVLLFYTP